MHSPRSDEFLVAHSCAGTLFSQRHQMAAVRAAKHPVRTCGFKWCSPQTVIRAVLSCAVTEFHIAQQVLPSAYVQSAPDIENCEFDLGRVISMGTDAVQLKVFQQIQIPAKFHLHQALGYRELCWPYS